MMNYLTHAGISTPSFHDKCAAKPQLQTATLGLLAHMFITTAKNNDNETDIVKFLAPVAAVDDAVNKFILQDLRAGKSKRKDWILGTKNNGQWVRLRTEVDFMAILGGTNNNSSVDDIIGRMDGDAVGEPDDKLNRLLDAFQKTVADRSATPVARCGRV